jgi:hypothetical protein
VSARVHLFIVHVNPGGLRPFHGSPVPKSTAELGEAAPGSEAGALQQFLRASVVNLADGAEPVMIVFAREDVLVADSRHRARTLPD